MTNQSLFNRFGFPQAKAVGQIVLLIAAYLAINLGRFAVGQNTRLTE